MQYIAPLLQTVLWVALVGAALWRFHRPLHDLLTALAKRVDAGSSIEAGPFKLSEQVRPQTQADQAKRLTDEAKEVLHTAESRALAPPSVNGAESIVTAAQFFVAEDLALRALQAEFGQVLSRQVIVGGDLGVDALFFKDAELNLLEVKFVPGAVNLEEVVRQTIRRIEHGVAMDKKLRHIRPNLIVALVHTSDAEVNASQFLLDSIAEASSLVVQYRRYSLPELQRRFGASAG